MTEITWAALDIT